MGLNPKEPNPFPLSQPHTWPANARLCGLWAIQVATTPRPAPRSRTTPRPDGAAALRRPLPEARQRKYFTAELRHALPQRKTHRPIWRSVDYVAGISPSSPTPVIVPRTRASPSNDFVLKVLLYVSTPHIHFPQNFQVSGFLVSSVS